MTAAAGDRYLEDHTAAAEIEAAPREAVCEHKGQLVELAALRMVACEGCGALWDTVERHFRLSAGR